MESSCLQDAPCPGEPTDVAEVEWSRFLDPLQVWRRVLPVEVIRLLLRVGVSCYARDLLQIN